MKKVVRGASVLIHGLALSLAVPAYAQDAAVATMSDGKAFADAAAKLSATRCSGAYAEMGRGLTSGARVSMSTMRGSHAGTAQSLLAIAGLSYSDPNVVAAAGTLFVVPTASGCQGQVTKIVSFAKSCEETAKTIAPTGASGTKLEGVTVHNMPQGQAIFIPDKSGCTVVSTVTAIMPS